VAVGAALLTGYPFTFSALREGMLDLMHYTGEAREKAELPFTVAAIGAVTAIALVLKDVGFVVSLSGSLFGCLLMFVVPAVMQISNIRSKAQPSAQISSPLSNADKLEIKLNYGLIAAGIVMTIVGVSVTVSRQISSH